MLLFRHHVIKNLLAAGRISQTTVDILDRFHHPGFSAYEGEGVSALDSAARGQRRRQNPAADQSPAPSCPDAVQDDDFRRF